MTRSRFLWTLAAMCAAGPFLSARQIVLTLSAAQVEEAIRLAADEKAARAFLQIYVVQARSGIGTGPLLGYIGTPFSRVVRAALTARKEGNAFDASDVTPDVIAPQLDVLVLNQSAAYVDLKATVQGVGITVRNAQIQPVSTKAATPAQYRLYELVPDNISAIVAVFPLDVAAPGATIRVDYSAVIRGSSALTNCQNCAAPFFSARLR